MDTQKVVVYTPAQDFFYNTEVGATILFWAVSIFAGFFIVYVINENHPRPLKTHWVVVLGACAAFTIHSVLIWIITKL